MRPTRKAEGRWVACLVPLITVGLLCALTGCQAPTAAEGSAIPVPTSSPTPEAAPSTTRPWAGPTLQRGPAHPDRATIIDGSWLIGTDYPPALYLVPTAVSRCHWRVVDYATGVLIEEGRYSGPGPAAIWVDDGDLLQSEGCLLWQGYAQLTGTRDASTIPLPAGAATIGDGRWVIGERAPAGRYRSDRGSSGACAYRVDRAGEGKDESFESTGTVRSIPSYLDLTLADGDVLTTRDCGPWQLLA